MRWFTEFRNAHKGKTMLLVGNGNNLHLTPPEDLDYPSIGMNTIVEYPDWMPDYFVTVDRRVHREFGNKIDARYADIPKFLPHPRLLRWLAPNSYFFRNRQGLLWPKNGGSLWQEDMESNPIIYGNCMHVAIKLAYYMGAKTILIVGMEHEPHHTNRHFWGDDEVMSPDQPTKDWQEGYSMLSENLAKHKVKLLNISEETFVPADIIPQDSWENWKKE